MTEAEWLAASDPRPMLHEHLLVCHLRRQTSDRKLRLFAVACCCRVRHLLTGPGVHALEQAERLAEGLASIDDCSRWCDKGPRWRVEPDPIKDWNRPPARVTVYEVASRDSWEAAARTARQTAHMGTVEAVRVHREEWLRHEGEAMAAQHAAQAELLRDIFGNPFHPVSFDATWLTPPVLALAQVAYDERLMPTGILDLARLAFLANTLEEAGCSDEALLGHLRSPGPHVRGCWVVDLVLAKE